MHSRALVASILFSSNIAWASTIGSRADFNHHPRRLTSGEARYYELDTGAQTTCGGFHKSTEMICALGISAFGTGEHCGKSLVIHHGGKQVTCMVDDKCQSCTANSLDVSPAVFQALAPLSEGVLKVDWNFV